MRKIKLSIVIPTKNRAEKLDMVLNSIAQQKVDQDFFEVIVIDNGSVDNTKGCVDKNREYIKNIVYIYDARPGLHVGRNRGIRESRGECIGFLDDDVILFPNWIETVLNAFEDENMMAVCGSVIPYDSSLITAAFKKKYAIKNGSFYYAYVISCFWEVGIDENDTREHRAKSGMLFGGNSVYRKKILLECQGFHPDGMPNDLLMYRGDGEDHVASFIFEHKMKVMYYAQASVYHQIDAKRVDKEYISYMNFRNGISHMYTCLRKAGIRGGVESLLDGIQFSTIIKPEAKQEILGRGYLFLYYLFYKQIRRWVHKKNYF